MNTCTNLFLVGAGVLLLGLAATTADAQTTYPEQELSLQPIVTEMETNVPTSAYGTSLSDPDGTETLWCGNGRPSYWVVGGMEYLHPSHVEGPLCYNSGDQTWTNNDSTIPNGLDMYYDPPANTQPIDRRDCLRMDVNGDTRQDIVCVVGEGNKNELYLTQADGTISKVPDGHGLQNYPTSGSKYIEKLKSYNGVDDLVFVVDDNENHHMYKTVPNFPYFEELPKTIINQPWLQYGLKPGSGITSDPIIVDLNGDDVDDMIVYNELGQSRMFVQNKDNGDWDEITLPDFKLTSYWKSARIEQLSSPTINPYPDLVVTWSYKNQNYVHVFGGMGNAPYFDFRRPIYSQRLDTVGTDVEVVDVNDDGNLDLYIVQRINDDDAGECSKDYNDPSSLPLDNGRDFLLLNNGNTALSAGGANKNMFTKYKMDFKGRGCGGLVRKFGNNGNGASLILTEGKDSHVGYNYLLEWK